MEHRFHVKRREERPRKGPFHVKPILYETAHETPLSETPIPLGFANLNSLRELVHLSTISGLPAMRPSEGLVSR